LQRSQGAGVVKRDDLAHELGEAIRRVLAHEHIPGCRCSKILRNECAKKILDEAFAKYCREFPDGVF
jgi:hypothetical protein